MDKYKTLFINKLKQTIDQWTELSTVPNEEVYRLLHSLKGTAASIGLDKFSEVAATKLEAIEEHGDKQWELEEWSFVLDEIISMLPHEIANNQWLAPNEIQPTNKKLGTHQYDPEDELILVVDDDIHLLDYLKHQLEGEGLNTQVAVNGEQALRVFYDLKPDCVVLDINLPGKSGYEVLEDIVEKSQLASIPIILMSADETKETKLKAYRLGASDFMSKPLDMEELVVRILNRLKQKKAIENSILLDELTGAFNRKFLKLEINRLLNEFNRSGKPFSLAMLDLDHFKTINDDYGHHIGDRVLRTFAETIMQHKRGADSLIRFGGEEFILLLPNTKATDAMNLLNRLLEHFSTQTFSSDNEEFFVSFSAGVSEVTEAAADDQKLIKQVDEALYDAKRAGRKQVKLFDISQLSTMQKQKVLHIGIVDDDPVIHQILIDHLSRMSLPDIHVKIQEFREGESFLKSEWVKQPGKFLILLDGMMPRMDGLEILHHLKKDRSKKDFTVLMLP